MIIAQRRFQSTKSALVGEVVDCFSNFDTVKLFASSKAIEDDHKIGLVGASGAGKSTMVILN